MTILMEYVYKAIVDDEKIIRTSKFYQSLEGDELKYGRALKKFKYHNELLQDLILEMTRGVSSFTLFSGQIFCLFLENDAQNYIICNLKDLLLTIQRVF